MNNYLPTPSMANWIVRKNAPATQAYYMLAQSRIHKLLCVADDDDKIIGVITESNFKTDSYWHSPYTAEDIENLTCEDICTKKFTYFLVDDDYYKEANYVISTRGLHIFPILDSNGYVKDILSSWQIKFLETYREKKLLRMHYAHTMVKAAKFALKKGYDSFSVLEFGVATGNGLLIAELFAKEIERLFHVKIEVYGFESCEGLISDLIPGEMNFWRPGEYKNEGLDKLKQRFTKAEVIYGDVENTRESFFETDFAPIGVVFVDVDVYRSTKSVFRFFDYDDKFFLPEVQMYFDDIHPDLEYTSEALALREFNAEHENMKITPENTYDITNNPMNRLKTLMRFEHPLFPSLKDQNKLLPLTM
jgi:hypothetical protein